MRVLSTAWSAYEIWRTHDINRRFDALITNGPCGVDLFPGYFSRRLAVQIADLSLNVVALLLSAYLVWKLVKVGFMPNRPVGTPRLNRSPLDICYMHVHPGWCTRAPHQALQGK